MVHFFRGFFSGRDGHPCGCGLVLVSPSVRSSSVAIRRILPLFSGVYVAVDASPSGSPECTPSPVSSRKLHAGKMRGEDGSASETRRCFASDDVGDGGNGAVNENVDEDGIVDVEGAAEAIVVGERESASGLRYPGGSSVEIGWGLSSPRVMKRADRNEKQHVEGPVIWGTCGDGHAQNAWWSSRTKLRQPRAPLLSSSPSTHYKLSAIVRLFRQGRANR